MRWGSAPRGKSWQVRHSLWRQPRLHGQVCTGGGEEYIFFVWFGKHMIWAPMVVFCSQMFHNWVRMKMKRRTKKMFKQLPYVISRDANICNMIWNRTKSENQMWSYFISTKEKTLSTWARNCSSAWAKTRKIWFHFSFWHGETLGVCYQYSDLKEFLMEMQTYSVGPRLLDCEQHLFHHRERTTSE